MPEQNPYPDDWQEEAPLLSSLRGQQPYDAPEGYFEELPGTVMDRIKALQADASSDGTSSFAPPPAKTWHWARYGMAACFVLLMGLSAYLVVRSLETAPEEGMELMASADYGGFSEDEILAEIDFSEVSDDELVSLMGDEALSAFEADQFDEEFNPLLDETDLDRLSDEDWGLLNLEGFEDLEYE